jgi:hypothetical protein
VSLGAVPRPQPLSADDYANALFGLGECLQSWADAVRDASLALADDQLTPAAEAEARALGARLLERSVDAYQQVRG